jgi:hypothetical protein
MTDEPLIPVPSPSAPPAFAAPLQGTQPWVRFLAVIGFIVAGFMVLFGLIGGAIGAALGRTELLPVMVLYPIFGALYVFPSMYLLRYANTIREFLASGQDAHLASALDAQRSFWKFAGILVIVWIIASIAIVVFAVGLGVLTGLGGRQIRV